MDFAPYQSPTLCGTWKHHSDRLYYILLYSILLYSLILSYTLLSSTILYYTILYYILHPVTLLIV